MRATRPWTSGSSGSDLGQHPPQAQGVGAQRRPHPVLARRRRVALVEDQVDDLEDRGQPGRPLVGAGHLEGDLGVGQGLLGPHDALGDRRLGHQVGAGDLRGGQAAEQAQGQRHPGRDAQDRVAGGEDQPQQVVVDVVGHGPVEARRRRRRPPRPAPGRARRSGSAGARCGGTGRWPAAWPRSSARRRGCGARRRPATARGRRRRRPGPAPRPGRRRG